MFGFLGKILGSDTALTSIVNSASNALDSLVYTDQEKAGDAAADRSEARKMVVAWMASTSGQNIARRVIALSVTFVWLMQYVVSQCISVAAIWVTESSDKLYNTSSILRDGANDMSGPIMLILGFYFAAPHMGDLVKAAMGRFAKSTETSNVKG